ncbi:MAG TPA: sigma-70 family RNA polymerase sigma factor [Acidobacteriaceae bacterium]|nr:sigma-70 family RNA polymerase sigma factor [Acidobacteriaceae bacterium]
MAAADYVFGALEFEPRSATPVVVEEPQVPNVTLLERMKAGDQAAFGTLYDRYCAMVYPMLLGVLKEPQAAEEVLRDLFVQLWHSAADFDVSRGSLPAWLMVMGRSLAMARLRMAQGQDPGEGLQTYPAHAMPSPFDMENEAQTRTVMLALRGAMAELPEEDRQTVELAYFEGLTEAELKWRTGGSREVVNARLLKGLKSLIETYGRTRQPGRI